MVEGGTIGLLGVIGSVGLGLESTVFLLSLDCLKAFCSVESVEFPLLLPLGGIVGLDWITRLCPVKGEGSLDNLSCPSVSTDRLFILVSDKVPDAGIVVDEEREGVGVVKAGPADGPCWRDTRTFPEIGYSPASESGVPLFEGAGVVAGITGARTRLWVDCWWGAEAGVIGGRAFLVETSGKGALFEGPFNANELGVDSKNIYK